MNKKIDLNDLGFISSVAKDLDEHLDDLIGVNKIIAGVGEFLDDYGLRHELGFSYSNQKNNLNKLSDDIKVFSDAATTGSGYNGYANVNSVEDILYSCLEHPFYLSLNDTIESLAEVEIERYKVDNPNGKSIVTMEEKWIESVYKNNTRVLKPNTHSKLGINDLLKTQYSRKLMKRNYERYLQTLYPDIKDFDGIDTDIFYDAYLTSILTQADFEHTTFLENSMNMLRTTGGILGAGVLFFSVVPGAATFFGINMGGLTMASGVVNGSISVIDAVCLFSGKDINGNPLSQEEREALIASVAIDATFLSVSVAGKIRYNSSKLANANTTFDVTRTVDDIKYQKWLEYADLGVDQKTRMKLMNWSITPPPDLYMKYKEVYDNSKFFNQETGSVIYPGTNGDVNLCGFTNGQHYTETLQPGRIVDRYGSDSGKYLSPIGTTYEERALPPFMETQKYTQYEVLKPFDVETGVVASWFGQSGGGTQFFSDKVITVLDNITGQFIQVEATIENLIKYEYIKELK